MSYTMPISTRLPHRTLPHLTPNQPVEEKQKAVANAAGSLGRAESVIIAACSAFTWVEESEPKPIEGKKPRKKKKVKVWQNWNCQECGTNETPERRSGPNGLVSLCNACGIKWRKSMKKQTEVKPSERMRVAFLLN